MLCIAVTTGAVSGQPSGPYDPPALSGESTRLQLLDAVRFTLDNDPALLTRSEDVQSQFGRFQESSGAFDWNVTGQLQYEYRVQELTESAKELEQGRRDQFFEAEFVACGLRDTLTTKLGELGVVEGGGNYTNISTDEGLRAQLQILEALISGAKGQEKALLEQSRANLLGTERAKTEEAHLLAAAACDEAGDSLERLGDAPIEEDFDVGRLNFRLEHLSRGGSFSSTYVRGVFNDTQYLGKFDGFREQSIDPRTGLPFTTPSGIPLDRLIDFGGKNFDEFYSLELGFDVNIPLLRNSGRDAVAAGERAAQIDWEASELLYRHAATESVLNTVFAYWNLAAAQEQRRILGRSGELQSRVVEITQALIDAEELPGVEEARALAAEARNRAQLEGAKRDLIKAQLDLVTAMGMTATGEETAVTARTLFLPPPTSEGLSGLEGELIRESRANRLDLQAARQLSDSGRVVARAATINLKPRFDLTLGAWATARGEGSLSAATDTWTGPSWKAGALIEKPIGNNKAKGQLVQGESQMRRRQISEADLERRVNIAVVRNLNSLVKALEELAYTEEAARQFEATFEAELEKLKAGETTVLDVTLTEQQRTRSQLALVSARFQVATLIAVLRFETGTLVEPDGEGTRITLDTLTGFPAPGTQS